MKKKNEPANTKPLNIRQERFAELVAGGMSATEAYVKAGYNVSVKVAGTNGPRLLENAGVKAHIAGIKAKAAARTEFKKDDLVRDLIKLWQTPVGEIDEKSQFAQEVVTDQVAGGSRGQLKRGKAAKGNETVEPITTRKRIKMVDKFAAARLLTELLGWKEPDQVVVETGPRTLEALESRAASIVSALDRNARK